MVIVLGKLKLAPFELDLVSQVLELADGIGNVGCNIDKVNGKIVVEFDIG